eukprot:CAMPEP_0197648864 /NCGR_PEP_ID=MMETSP1338-20131121/28006_1 /TAXON_ID=43686 ORGANISM="Pelagodinium beii, Strain RCC1491" /NCGR_SAMPLE_ID=MMETSP1338 /ASSEMBLY_ACC=CAM_ASM_000754 /LENGTH=181 /DNA_ID=CAMNT_0043222931 /DNA_START=39 /DNA_END=584 /DNA_ORIENTATION=-
MPCSKFRWLLLISAVTVCYSSELDKEKALDAVVKAVKSDAVKVAKLGVKAVSDVAADGESAKSDVADRAAPEADAVGHQPEGETKALENDASLNPAMADVVKEEGIVNKMKHVAPDVGGLILFVWMIVAAAGIAYRYRAGTDPDLEVTPHMAFLRKLRKQADTEEETAMCRLDSHYAKIDA